ncbi:flagellin lysine-N-methylase (plasmid) [Bacillus cereus]|uniref:flagellin lysine-N-methylase n=1 Tax=Bacillus cereus TaxID=1396 RepID=UPI001F162160|nr:flagellin lysine-N-methylase [Bacillus cereus]UIJ69566.1 flagellin lysine-N-methylase [Bacillus cereus]
MKQNFFTSKHISEFSCIGSQCEDNCCNTNWTVFINKEKYELYRKMDEKNDSNLLQSIEKNVEATNEENYAILKFNTAGACSFLTEEKLCSIHLEHGSSALCNTCRYYPRVTQTVHHTYYETGYLSCPEMARLVLLSTIPFEWTTSVDRDSQDALVVPYNSPSNLNYVKKVHTYITHLLSQREIHYQNVFG